MRRRRVILVGLLLATLSAGQWYSLPAALADISTSTFDLIICDGTSVSNPPGCSTALVGGGNDNDGNADAGESVEVRAAITFDTTTARPATEPSFDSLVMMWGPALIPGADAAITDGALVGQFQLATQSNLSALGGLTSNVSLANG